MGVNSNHACGSTGKLENTFAWSYKLHSLLVAWKGKLVWPTVQWPSIRLGGKRVGYFFHDRNMAMSDG